MRGRALLAGLAALTALLAPAAASSALAERLQLATRPGVTVTVDLREAEDAIALLLLFEGGGGKFKKGSSGFAHLAHDRFGARGIATALVDAPSDQRGFRGGMHPDFRLSEDHLADIDAVIAALRARSGLPVWVLGISLGTRSAAWYAVQRPDKVDGVVLLSSSTASPRGRPVYSFPLQVLSVPLLAVVHEQDACRTTPPQGAHRIVAAAGGSPAAEVKTFSGGRNVGRDPCGTRTHHTFFGIEDEVVAAIAAFIADHSS